MGEIERGKKNNKTEARKKRGKARQDVRPPDYIYTKSINRFYSRAHPGYYPPAGSQLPRDAQYSSTLQMLENKTERARNKLKEREREREREREGGREGERQRQRQRQR